MGCTPTAQRLSTIPSNNVNPSSRSTRSTIKNSDGLMSPQKLNFDQEKCFQKNNIKRYYSPKYVPTGKVNEVTPSPLVAKRKDFSRQKARQNLLEAKENISTQNLDIVSHLSINSQFNSRQNPKLPHDEVHIPKKSKYGLKSPDKKFVQKPTSEEHKFQSDCFGAKSPSNRKCDILERELKDMNYQKFERINIQKMHY